MAYNRVNWQSGTKVSDGYVEIEGTQHTVTPAVYSGSTPINPTSLNIMDEGIEENSKLLNGKLTVEEVTLDKVEFKNKFNKDTIIENSIIDLDGSVLSGYTNWCATDFIPIKGNTKYVYQGITNPGSEKYSAYYDSNKQFISEFEQESGFNKRITTPNGACYVRFSMLISDIDDFQLELGEWSTEYAAYMELNEVYSTSEKVIGKWIDGKPIYRKVINLGALPNNTDTYTAHNISNLGTIVSLTGMAYNSTNENRITLPYIDPTAQYIVQMFATNTNIVLVSGYDQSVFDESFCIIEYTKTTD